MKRKYGGGQSKESAKISWARHVLQGRTAMVVVEGPDGAPAETTHPDGCERAPPDSGSERDRNCCDAGARWRRISRADRGRWVLLRGVSTVSRLLWISVDEVVVAEGEKIWGSYGETTAYIARCPARFGGNIGAYRRHRFVQLRCRPIGSFSTPARTNSRAVSLRD